MSRSVSTVCVPMIGISVSGSWRPAMRSTPWIVHGFGPGASDAVCSETFEQAEHARTAISKSRFMAKTSMELPDIRPAAGTDPALLAQAEHHHGVAGGDVHPPVDDGRRDVRIAFGVEPRPRGQIDD